MSELATCPNPECGQPGYVSSGPCEYCGYKEAYALQLTTQDGKSATFNISRFHLNKDWAKIYFGDERRFWDDKNQFSIKKDNADWYVVPNPSAPNETLVNGIAQTAETLLQEGDRIAIGRQASGIEKTILYVGFV